MVCGNTKRIVVIRDINSDIIEEAILILKNDPGINNKNINGIFKKNKKIESRSLIKEAELIIDNYMKENGLNKQPVRGQGTDGRADGRKRNFIINAAINMALLGSITLLIFLIIRLI